jgi:hypothetical protein
VFDEVMPVEFTRCRVLANATGPGGSGGGLYLADEEFILEHGVVFNYGFIIGNRSPRGGGVFVDGTRLYLHNSVINANIATGTPGRGGAIGVATAGNVVVRFCTVHGNEARGSGGAGHSDGISGGLDVEGLVEIESSILWNNGDTSLDWWSGRFPATEYSNVGRDRTAADGPGAGPVCPINMAVTDICSDPGLDYAASSIAGAVYVLKKESECRGRAHPYTAPGPAALPVEAVPLLPWCRDIAGGCRMVGANPDIGAYEVQDPPPEDCGYCTYG